jgi:hypothetical protein
VKSLLAVAAEHCVVDQRTNNLAVISVIEELTSATFPFVFPRLVFATLTEKTEAEPSIIEGVVEGRLNDQVIFSVPIKLDFHGRRKCRSIIDLQMFVIPSPGSLSIVQKHSEEILGRWDIPVSKLGPSVTVGTTLST